MAFDIKNWARSTDSMNTGQETLKNGDVVNAPAIFTYRSSDDDQATIGAANYFASRVHDLALNDIIFAVGTDAVAVYSVAAIDRIARTITVAGTSVVASVDTANIVDGAVTTPKIDDEAVTLAKLDDDVAPSHVTKFADQHTTVGSAAAEVITVIGVLATDLAFVQLVDDGTNNVSVVSAAVTSDTLTVTFSGDPGSDAVINYQVIRAAV